MTNLVRLRRLSIVVRIACAGSFSLVLFAVAMQVFVKSEVEHAIYAETDTRVQVAQNTMWDLLRAKGTPSLVDGVLRLGYWKANGDNSVVDLVRELTGADATLFAIIDSTPIRVTTTIRKLGTSERILHTELVGPARVAIDAGRISRESVRSQGDRLSTATTLYATIAVASSESYTLESPDNHERHRFSHYARHRCWYLVSAIIELDATVRCNAAIGSRASKRRDYGARIGSRGCRAR